MSKTITEHHSGVTSLAVPPEHRKALRLALDERRSILRTRLVHLRRRTPEFTGMIAQYAENLRYLTSASRKLRGRS